MYHGSDVFCLPNSYVWGSEPNLQTQFTSGLSPVLRTQAPDCYSDNPELDTHSYFGQFLASNSDFDDLGLFGKLMKSSTTLNWCHIHLSWSKIMRQFQFNHIFVSASVTLILFVSWSGLLNLCVLDSSFTSRLITHPLSIFLRVLINSSCSTLGPSSLCNLLDYKTYTCKHISLTWLCWSSNTKNQTKWAKGPFSLQSPPCGDWWQHDQSKQIIKFLEFKKLFTC